MVLDAIKNRRSVRNFKTDSISDDQIIEILTAGSFAPTAKNNRAVEYVIVKDDKVKKQIYDILAVQAPQEFIKKAPVLVIPVTDQKKSGLPREDLAVSSENIFIQAAGMGIGSVWKNVYPDTACEIQKILNIPQNFVLINIIPLGYPEKTVESHETQNFTPSKIHWGKW